MKFYQQPTGSEIIGQYPSDYEVHAGNPALFSDNSGTKTMRGDGAFGFHRSETLFDESHGYIDEGTGEAMRDHSTVTDDILAIEGITIAMPELHRSRERQESLDAAGQWLTKNDPKYGKHSSFML